MSDALQSVTTKIVRAMKHQELFNACIADYTKLDPFRIVPQSHSAPTLEISKQPPIDLSILAGEVLYQLRSALDHLFFAIIRENIIGPLPKQIVTKSQFPIYTYIPGDGVTIPVPKCDLKMPDWFPDAAYTFIERLQPHYTGHDGNEQGRRMMRLLVTLSNIDKHRHLNTTVARVDRHHTITTDKFSTTVIVPFLDNGAKIYPPSHFGELGADVTVNDKFTLKIAFDEPEAGPPQSVPLEDVVYELPTFVFWVTTALKQFLR